MSFKLPKALVGDDNQAAIDVLQRYYGRNESGQRSFTGSAFDTWDPYGTRAADADRFTSDDFTAIAALSMTVSAKGLDAFFNRSAGLNALLVEVGPDRDLADEENPFPDDWAGWRLMDALRDRNIPDIGTTKASKLFARKRPRLRPIWDSVVYKVTDTKKHQWEPLRLALRENDRALHLRLLRLRAAAGLSEEVSALRVFDVIAWMQGRG